MPPQGEWCGSGGSRDNPLDGRRIIHGVDGKTGHTSKKLAVKSFGGEIGILNSSRTSNVLPDQLDHWCSRRQAIQAKVKT